MRFRNFLEAINTPPHMPFQFYEEYAKAFRHVHVLLEKVNTFRNGFYNFAKEFTSTPDRYAIDSIVNDVPRWLGDKVKRITENLRWVFDTKEADIQRKFLKLTIDDGLLKELNEIDFEAIDTAIHKLKKEMMETQGDWDSTEWGSYEERLSQVEQLKKLTPALKKMKDWYKNYVVKTTSYVNSATHILRKEKPPTERVETLYHATTAINAILREGFKTRSELGRGALGGGPSDVISFTADLQIAESIVYALRRAHEVSSGKMNYRQLEMLGKHFGVWDKAVETTNNNYGKFDYISSFDYSHTTTPRTTEQKKEWLFSCWRTILAFQSRIYDPWFAFVTYEDFEKLNPTEIGIVAAEVAMDKITEYLPSMEEYRVPIAAIGKVWKVPYTGVMKPQVRY